MGNHFFSPGRNPGNTRGGKKYKPAARTALPNGSISQTFCTVVKSIPCAKIVLGGKSVPFASSCPTSVSRAEKISSAARSRELSTASAQ